MIWRKHTLNLFGRIRRGFYSSQNIQSTEKPLKIAFFGSDDFSIASLRKLVDLSKDKTFIESIELIAKHPRLTGRGLKELKDVPIVEYAESINLPIVRADKKTEIIDLIPRDYSLAIAVSYGKLIPQEFIQAVPHSLNVHPSLLPKYSGASPLQFALLNQDEFTGVTVQTLHPTEFDKGAIVDQTEPIKIQKEETLDTLTCKLAERGAELLAKVLKDGTYKDPSFISKYEYSYASKITKEMSQVEWRKSASSIKRQYDTLGPLYSFKEVKLKKRRKPLSHDFRRVLFFDIEVGDDVLGLKPGEFQFKNGVLSIQTLNGSIIPKELQFEFEKKESATKFFDNIEKRSGIAPPNIFVTRQSS